MVSIIMAVYNAEKTLSYAIESVLNQTYNDWELLVIDDKSIDNSFKIIESFSYKDTRIKVYRNFENLGPAATRNKGIEQAQGSYIGFIDADDSYEDNFIKKMIDCALLYNAEIVWCQYISQNNPKGSGYLISNDLKKNIVFDNKTAVNFFFNKIPGISPLWNKIYKKDFLKNNEIRLNTERVRAEDWEFNLLAFSKVNKLVLIEDFLYNYGHQNKTSIMSTLRKNDYYMMWRSQELLKKINCQYHLGYSLKDIYNINPDTLLEFIYKTSKFSSYNNYKNFFNEKRFLEFISLIDLKKLPKTYQIICELINRDLWRIAYLFSRFSHIFHKVK